VRQGFGVPTSRIADRYDIVAPLGQGGTSTTYLVHDVVDHVQLALKLLRSDVPSLIEALRFEFRTLQSIVHPSLCPVHHFGFLSPTVDPSLSHATCFYTAEAIVGVTLDLHAKNHAWEEALLPLLEALDALRFLHRAGIRHGDFKPANVLVRPDHSGVLVDLGCACPLDMPPSAHVSGTPAFLAPELLRGDASDARADLFSIGVTLRRLARLTRSPPPNAHADLLRRLTQPDPSQRPGSVDEVLLALGFTPAPIPPAATWRGRFVGREPLLSAAQRAIDALLADSEGPRILSLLGYDGVGRSRLLQEIEWQAQPRCRVLRAGSRSLRPIEDLLSRALREPVGPGILPVVDAIHRLSAGPHGPLLLLVDDVHRLPDDQLQHLLAVARSLSARSRVLLLCATTPDQPLSIDAQHELRVDPLSPTDLSLWLEPAFPPAIVTAIHRATGGYPDAVNAAVGQLRTEFDITHVHDSVTLNDQRARAVIAMSAADQRAIGLLALLEEPVTTFQAQQLGVPIDTLQSLRSAGFLDRQAAEWKLTRTGEAVPLVKLLPDALRAELHARVADWLLATHEAASDAGAAARAERLARVAQHLVLADRVDDAVRLLLSHEAAADQAPRAWSRCLQVVLKEARLDTTTRCEMLLLAARTERAAGRAREALSLIHTAPSQQAPATIRARLTAETGACHAALGHSSEAEVCLQAALDETADTALRAVVLENLARSLLHRGAYEQAKITCHMASETGDAVPELLCLEAMACSYLGQAEQAWSLLQKSKQLIAATGRPRTHVRAITTLALHDLREGNLDRATAGLEEALTLAQKHGLADQVANLCLNLGVALHQRGVWAQALLTYEQGLRIAAALGRKPTEATLLCNLAKAHADLGDFERSRRFADRARGLASRLSLPLLVASADAVQADIEQAQGHTREALARLLAARTAFDASGSVEELVEVVLQMAELAVDEDDVAQARQYVTNCEERTPPREGYLTARLSLVRSRVLAAEGRVAEALDSGERALASFRTAGHRDAEAEAHLLLSTLASAQAAPHLAETHLSSARTLWERAAASLPAAERAAFWTHPRRVRARPEEPSPTAPPRALADSRMRRLLDINKRLNSSLRMDDVLRETMDAAIELTGAERGFLLLQEQDASGRPKLVVGVARNVDREQVGRSHLKFSRGIARRVIQSGQLVVSTNAVQDGRFEREASVHAMQLKSVVCVPIHSPQGVLGALYLDNRFQPSKFSNEDVDLLMAFADQAALALRNARLMDALAQRNDQLETERRRVQELAEGQAAEIDRLHEQVRETRRSVARRFDYDAIVGASAPMQRVFDVLDRVTETSIPVLIQGESGTGKELIARALHHNGPRRKRRLVSINCAALPDLLLESELFGHVRGAFTGADRDHEGLVIQAAGGTLFLDEIAELSLPTQAKLLRALQEREVQPLGASHALPVDFRLVCATNRNLQEQVARGAFREDLFYRIAVVVVPVPPLRDRIEDIPALAEHILRRVVPRSRGVVPTLSAAAMRKLLRAPWPGNVRQLENSLTRATVLAQGELIEASDIELPEDNPPRSTASAGRATFEQAERGRIIELLESHRWNVRKVAPLLGLPRSTLYRKLARYGIAVRGRSTSSRAARPKSLPG
jgi:transcriptional regulator with GAF, ATPase, and Fis domain/serine/threonine protein kinase/Tfp pilus assembly protein PilF